MTANPALEQIATSTKKLKLCATNHYPDLKSKRYYPVLDMIATPSCPFGPKIRLLTDKFPPVSSVDDRHTVPNPVGNRCSHPPLQGFPRFCNTRPCTSNLNQFHLDKGTDASHIYQIWCYSSGYGVGQLCYLLVGTERRG